jgi:hypothetical protein
MNFKDKVADDSGIYHITSRLAKGMLKLVQCLCDSSLTCLMLYSLCRTLDGGIELVGAFLKRYYTIFDARNSFYQTKYKRKTRQ